MALFYTSSSNVFRGFVIDGLSVIYKGYGIMVVSLKSSRYKNKRTDNQKATSNVKYYKCSKYQYYKIVQ
jgi:hypothetical protein